MHDRNRVSSPCTIAIPTKHQKALTRIKTLHEWNGAVIRKFSLNVSWDNINWHWLDRSHTTRDHSSGNSHWSYINIVSRFLHLYYGGRENNEAVYLRENRRCRDWFSDPRESFSMRFAPASWLYNTSKNSSNNDLQWSEYRSAQS